MKQILLTGLLLIGIKASAQEEVPLPLSVTQKDSLAVSKLQQRILIINSFDAMSIKGRNNKRELFRELTDSLIVYLSEKVKALPNREAVIIPNILSKTNELDSHVYSLMKENKAGLAIVVWSLNAHFEEAGEEEETDEEDGKPRTITSYNLCATNEYLLYNNFKVLKQSTIENCEFFTSRSVKGRFVIKFGPDIVGKRKHTYKRIENNASAYLAAISHLLGQ